MKPAFGTALPRLPVSLHKARDLEVYDGPLLSAFVNDAGDVYLRAWCDADANINRWLLFRTARLELIKFMHGLVTLHGLLTASMDSFVYVLDYGKGHALVRVAIATLSEIPQSYMPAEDSYHDPDLDPALDEHGGSGTTRDVLLDKRWSVEDLAAFPDNYSKVYFFIYVVGASVEASKTFQNYRLEGGYVFGTFYRELGKMVEKRERPGIDAISYSSPGFMTLRLNPYVGEVVTDVVQRFLSQKKEIKDEYDYVRRWSSLPEEQRRRETDKPQKRRRVKHLVVEPEEMKESLTRLADLLGYVDLQKLMSLTGGLVNAGRIMCSYYRRVALLARYQQQGKATFL